MSGAWWRGAAVALLACLALTSAHPGRGCEATRPTALAVQRSIDLALRTSQALDASGAQVVLLARAGQDLSRWRLRWSHMGWAYRDGGGAWRVLHKLNACGSDHGDLYRQGLAEFFLDDPFEQRTAWAVPAPGLQARLLPLLADDRQATRLHTRAYNMVAYPWAQRYQQSNQWAIEMLALAADPRADTRGRAQAWLRRQGYAPTVLHVPALMRLGANLGSAHIAFDDHPNGERFAGRIATVSVDSVFHWLQRSALAQPVTELAP